VLIRLLGPVDIVWSSGDEVVVPGSKMRGVLALLALEAGRAVTPQRLIDGVWGDEADVGPNVVQVVISKLRRLLADGGEPDRLVTRPTGYELQIERDAVDALRFEQLVEHARNAAPESSVTSLVGALALWRGAALTGVPDSGVLDARRSRLEEHRRLAHEELIDARLSLGDHARLVADIELLVADEPFRERRWGQLIRALYGSGRQADAARAFQRARDVLVEQVGVEPSAELRRLESAVLAQDDEVLGAPPRAAAPAPLGVGFRRRGNLRHAIGRCVGREQEIEDVARSVRQNRLVTISGPGGVGKTRLSLEVGRLLRDGFDGGVWWVELASARTATDIVATVMRSLGLDVVPAVGPTVPDAMVAALEDRPALVVVDNCEHLVDEVRQFVGQLLGECETLRVLTTSRESLGLPGEALVELAPLPEGAAVELFRSLAVTGAISDTDDDVVAAICSRLDHLPLAIELAAARMRHLRADELLTRLRERLEAFDARSPVASPQRNLRSVAQWSYELLPESERIVFERLSVFADGATLDAARAVCGAHPLVVDPVDRCLARLVDKSLVIADRSAPVSRYRLLQTLADFARECLAARGDVEAASRCHAEWVTTLASTVRFGTPTDGPTVATVQDEDVAIRDALHWAITHEPLVALRIAESLTAFWFGTMRVSVGSGHLTAALHAAGAADPALRSSALAWAHLFAVMQQDHDAARALLDESVTFEEALSDPQRIATLHLLLMLADGYRGVAEPSPSEAVARSGFESAGSMIGLSFVEFAHGARRLVGGDVEGGAEQLRRSIAGFREHGDHLGLILAVSRLGELAWRIGDVDLFADMHRTMIDLGRSGRIAGVVSGATARLAHARLLQGDAAEARRLADTALASTSDSFMPVVAGYCFRSAGLVNLHLGHVADGRRQLLDAIAAFSDGAGGVGLGQAAMCWLDIAESHRIDGELALADQALCAAADIADRAGDPWIRARVDAACGT
jgi:predicted ATPase/DNA-binding SARP family transcriptional activator